MHCIILSCVGKLWFSVLLKSHTVLRADSNANENGCIITVVAFAKLLMPSKRKQALAYRCVSLWGWVVSTSVSSSPYTDGVCMHCVRGREI